MRETDTMFGKSQMGMAGKTHHAVCPDPPTIAFLEKARVLPQKARVFLFAEPLKSLEKKGKCPKKQGKSENKESKEIEKSKDWRVRVGRENVP